MQKAALCKDRRLMSTTKKRLQSNDEQMIRKLSKSNTRDLRNGAIKTTSYDLVTVRKNSTMILLCLIQGPQPKTRKPK